MEREHDEGLSFGTLQHSEMGRKETLKETKIMGSERLDKTW